MLFLSPNISTFVNTNALLMEHSYVKSFPGLMAGKTILYVHGFASSAQSGTVKLLSTLLPDAAIIAEDLPLHPAEAMDLLRGLCSRHAPSLIIGSSAGGMMAEQLRGYDRILVNPAFQMGETMLKNGMLGKMEYQNPRRDGVQEFMVTKALVKEYAELTEQCFKDITAEERARVYGLFGDRDPVVHTFDLFHSHYPQAIGFHGEHRLVDKVALHYLIPVVRWVDDRQEGRERPVVYLAQDALSDAYGKPRPSLHKAYELLLEHYQVYVVCPAPTNDHAAMGAAQAWVEEWLSAPAHDRILFANQLQLLYGDYLISTADHPEYMGTTIRLGSDEFKSWDDIITFFERLGGQ